MDATAVAKTITLATTVLAMMDGQGTTVLKLIIVLIIRVKTVPLVTPPSSITHALVNQAFSDHRARTLITAMPILADITDHASIM